MSGCLCAPVQHQEKRKYFFERDFTFLCDSIIWYARAPFACFTNAIFQKYKYAFTENYFFGSIDCLFNS